MLIGKTVGACSACSTGHNNEQHFGFFFSLNTHRLHKLSPIQAEISKK